MATGTRTAPDGDPVLVVVGPTATGKTAVGLALAEALGGEIINADALQIYRGFDIGTAKPSAEELARAPHHLIDILDPEEPFSAGEFTRRARIAIEDIRSRGRRPILVGGTGLYIRALLEGIHELPDIDPEVRQTVRRRFEAEGAPALHRELQGLDPETAARLPPGDSQRIQRALEVVLSSGVPLSEWIRRPSSNPLPLRAQRIGLTLERAILYDRIACRIEDMVERGWVAEVRGLLHRGIQPEAPAFQAIGYRQIVRHVMGDWSLEQALEDTVRASRRYAKRQMTWFRKERDVQWFEALDLEHTISIVIRRIN